MSGARDHRKQSRIDWMGAVPGSTLVMLFSCAASTVRQQVISFSNMPTSPPPSVLDLARMIDHSLLHPTLTDDQLSAGLAVARRCSCATACVKPYAVSTAVAALAGSGVGVCAVAGFPHGNSHVVMKVAEVGRALVDGATEIDVVVNIGKVLSGDWQFVSDEVRMFQQTCAARGGLLKVIFENDYLQPTQIIRLCEICTEHRVAFVKTSTGYGFVKQSNGDYNYAGATDEHLRLMRQHAGPTVQIKAAGGVRTLDDLLRVRALGVTRIGATATETILAEAIRRGLPPPIPPEILPVSNASAVAPAGY
jgi:deoxyribose-phosphate aldolase